MAQCPEWWLTQQRSRFKSQHPHSDSQLPVTPVPGNLMPSLTLTETRHTRGEQRDMQGKTCIKSKTKISKWIKSLCPVRLLPEESCESREAASTFSPSPRLPVLLPAHFQCGPMGLPCCRTLLPCQSPVLPSCTLYIPAAVTQSVERYTQNQAEAPFSLPLS